MGIKSKDSLVVLLALVLAAAVLVSGCGPKAPEEDRSITEEEEELEEESIEEEEEEEEELLLRTVKKISPIAVVIDNNPSARPQSGLQEATLVYEFLVEGGLTRFLAVFDALPLEKINIGPVRSLRPYFAFQALEHTDTVVHSGYSHRTEQIVKGLKIKHVVSSAYLQRDGSRKAPYNLYTDTDSIEKLAGSSTIVEIGKEGSTPHFPFDYEEGIEIEIVYSKANVVSYIYDGESSRYFRSLRGQPHKDREKLEQYWAHRVILRYNRHTSVSGTNLVDIDVSGEGRAVLFEKGRKYELTWKKADGATGYYYADGSPVDLSFGSTWIQVVR